MSGILNQQQLAELSEKHQISIPGRINCPANKYGPDDHKDIETALTTITALKEETAGIETLVPIGFGSFVKANLVNTDTIVVGLGRSKR